MPLDPAAQAMITMLEELMPRVEHTQIHEQAHGTAVGGQPPVHRVGAVAVAGRERDHVAAGPDCVVGPAPRRALGLPQRLHESVE